MPRKATWLVIIWTGLMLVWAVSVPNTVGEACLDRTSNRTACEIGANIGGSIGLFVIFVIWFVGFMITGLVWLMTRPARRLCPACGHQARKGVSVCTRCGFDFRAAAIGQPTFQPLSPTGPPPGWGQQPPPGPGQPQQPPPGPPSGWGQPPTQGSPGWGPPPDPSDPAGRR